MVKGQKSKRTRSKTAAIKERGGSSIEAIKKKWLSAISKVDAEILVRFIRNKHRNSARTSRRALLQAKRKGAPGSFNVEAVGEEIFQPAAREEPGNDAERRVNRQGGVRCSNCNAWIKCWWNLAQHQRSQRCGARQPIILRCPACRKRFTRKGNLKRHCEKQGHRFPY